MLLRILGWNTMGAVIRLGRLLLEVDAGVERSSYLFSRLALIRGQRQGTFSEGMLHAGLEGGPSVPRS